MFGRKWKSVIEADPQQRLKGMWKMTELEQIFKDKATVKLETGTALAIVKHRKECSDIALNAFQDITEYPTPHHEGRYQYYIFEREAPVEGSYKEFETDGCHLAVAWTVKPEVAAPVVKKLQASTAPSAPEPVVSSGGCKSDGSALLPFLLLCLIVGHGVRKCVII